MTTQGDAPFVRDADADASFRRLLASAGMECEHRFGGGYVRWEWR